MVVTSLRVRVDGRPVTETVPVCAARQAKTIALIERLRERIIATGVRALQAHPEKINTLPAAPEALRKHGYHDDGVVGAAGAARGKPKARPGARSKADVHAVARDARPKISTEDLAQLMDLGFDAGECLEAFNDAGGNVTVAADRLCALQDRELQRAQRAQEKEEEEERREIQRAQRAQDQRAQRAQEKEEEEERRELQRAQRAQEKEEEEERRELQRAQRVQEAETLRREKVREKVLAEMQQAMERVEIIADLRSNTCAEDDCQKRPAFRSDTGALLAGGFCGPHAAQREISLPSRFCSAPFCGKQAKARGLCRAHGGVNTCSEEGCDEPVAGNGTCKAHGGMRKKVCTHEGCKRIVMARGLCQAHGGIECSEEGCNRMPVGRGLCRPHGGKGFCSKEGCDEPVAGFGVCKAHGGGSEKKVCTHEDCERIVVARGLCQAHGGKEKKVCTHEDCERIVVARGPVPSARREGEEGMHP